MLTTRFALVLVLLLAVPSSGYSQIFRPRLRLARAIDAAVREKAPEWAAQAVEAAVKEALAKIDQELAPLIDIELSMRLFAEIEMDPELKKSLDGNTDRDPQRAALKELLDKGGAKVFLSETAKFAEKLKNDRFSLPVLQKIYLEFEWDVPSLMRNNAGKDDSVQVITTLITKGDLLGRSELPKEPSEKRTIKCVESSRPKDPTKKMPNTIHCSLVFKTQCEDKEFLKTLSFDLYLEELKQGRDVKEVTIFFPWKVNNVQYKNGSSEGEKDGQ